jgi:hypothetical protein
MSKKGFKPMEQRKVLIQLCSELGITDVAPKIAGGKCLGFSQQYNVDISSPALGEVILKDHYRPYISISGSVNGDLSPISEFLYNPER